MLRKALAGVLTAAILAAGILVARHFAAPRKTIAPVIRQEKIRGPVLAPVTLQIFSDFQCPACRMALLEEEKILREYPGKVRFIYYHFPLSAHRLSPLAHQAAECAARQDGFWAYHDLLYGGQTQWSLLDNPLQTFLGYARDSGLDLTRFSTCLTDPTVQQRIREEKEYGESLQVQSTPTFFVEGERFIGGLELSQGGAALIRKKLGVVQ